MAAEQFGPKSEPIFIAGGAPEVDVDPSQAAKYASFVGNYIIGTAAQRTTFTHPDWPDLDEPWEGLNWYERDTGSTKRFQSGSWREILFDSGWANIGQLGSSFVSGWSGPASDGFPAAGFKVISGVVHFRGVAAKSNTIAANDGAFILPASVRPTTSREVTVLQGSDIKGARVNADGVLRILVAGENSIVLIGSYAI